MIRQEGELWWVEPNTCQEIWQPNLIASSNFEDPLRVWWPCTGPAQDIATFPMHVLLTCAAFPPAARFSPHLKG